MFAINGVIGNIIALIINYNYIFHLQAFVRNTIYSMMLGTILWALNENIYHFIQIRYPWLKNATKTLFAGITLTSVGSFLAIFLFNYIWFILLMGLDYSDFIRSSYNAWVGTIIAVLIISLAIHAGIFLVNWKKAVIYNENLKREQLAMQYEALKNQVNPHFLFNSLNVLTSLVYKDPDIAAGFIKQLSEVYRYVLDQKDKELVEFDTEIQFVKKYIYLQNMRFDKHLIVNMDIPEGYTGSIIPLSLQMLVENAIKHNEVSEENPLEINIQVEDGYVVVRNSLHRKMVIKESSKIGLANIKARYEFLTQKKFTVEETDNEFIVKLPLLNII